MDQNLVDKLRIHANQFYLNKYMDHPTISDSEYDKLVVMYESEGNSVKDLIEFEDRRKLKNEIKIGLNKEAVQDNDLKSAVERRLKWLKTKFNTDSIEYYLNLKYDGCAIIGLYENGKLKSVRSTPDEEFGIDRTKTFWNLFPHELEDKSIIALQGEALVDWNCYGQKARNKANGLTNSIDMVEEAERELFVRVYKVYFSDSIEFDYHRSLNALNNLPTITRNRLRRDSTGKLQIMGDIVFSSARQFLAYDCPTEALTSSLEGNFQCDGVVMYSPQGPLGLKFYFTEYAITTVRNIKWELKPSGSYSAVVEFDPVTINDKCISKASSGGVPNLMDRKMGVGAKVKVILANLTIPQIIETIVPSENYNWPKCSCGYQMSDKDIFGSTLKCQSESMCQDKYRIWVSEYKSYVSYCITNSVDRDWCKVLDICLHLDRWNADSKLTINKTSSEFSSLIEGLIESSITNDRVRFLELITKSFRLSELNMRNLKANLGTSIYLFREISLNTL